MVLDKGKRVSYNQSHAKINFLTFVKLTPIPVRLEFPYEHDLRKLWNFSKFFLTSAGFTFASVIFLISFPPMFKSWFVRFNNFMLHTRSTKVTSEVLHDSRLIWHCGVDFCWSVGQRYLNSELTEDWWISKLKTRKPSFMIELQPTNIFGRMNSWPNFCH